MLGNYEEIQIGDTVICNIFYTGISVKEYIRRLEMIASNKTFDAKKSSNHIQVPTFRGVVSNKKNVLKGSSIITVKCGETEIALLDNCWNKIRSDKKG
jgi:hypothetical protein